MMLAGKAGKVLYATQRNGLIGQLGLACQSRVCCLIRVLSHSLARLHVTSRLLQLRSKYMLLSISQGRQNGKSKIASNDIMHKIYYVAVQVRRMRIRTL